MEKNDYLHKISQAGFKKIKVVSQKPYTIDISPELGGARAPVVKNSYNCVVLCTGCESQCPEGATHHPSKEVTRKIIKNLQNFKSG